MYAYIQKLLVITYTTDTSLNNTSSLEIVSSHARTYFARRSFIL